MNKTFPPGVLVLSLLTGGSLQADALPQLLEGYTRQGATAFSADAGERLWKRTRENRGCGSCHGNDLRQQGKHVKTGKLIEPLAPSVNPTRLTDSAKISKWLKRNCKWTFGRACSAQEKGDLLSFIQHQ
jgi:hypothetical protein